MNVKGILHAHSSYSYDAKLTLAELKEFWKRGGIQFVCMTEHTDRLTKERAAAFVRECDELSDSSFQFIPGFEVPYRLPTGEHAHILMVGQRTFHEPYARTIDELRAWSREAPFVVLAHPVRNAFVVDPLLLGELDAIEVWNQQYEGKQVPRTRSLRLFKELHAQKPMLHAVGGVDFHRKEHAAVPSIALSVASLTTHEILEKLHMGAFQISSAHTTFFGTLPDIEVQLRAHRLRSALSVFIIRLGKLVNATLARLGFKLPPILKEIVRARV